MLQYPNDAQEVVKQISVMDVVNKHPVFKSFLTGAVSGTCSTLLFQPLDLVKTRLQNPVGLAPGMLNGGGMVSLALQVVKDERLVGLWRGTVPSVVRCVPGVGMYFCSLHWLQSNLLKEKNPSALEAVCLGVVARSLAGVTLLPVTVIKTRLESGVYSYGSLSGGLSQLYHSEGARGLFSGLIPTLFRDAPFSGLYLLFYTQIKSAVVGYYGMNENTTMKPASNFLCGLLAGSMASVITQPADVIKTRLQVYPKEYRRFRHLVTAIFNEQGLKGFFRGLCPRLVRRTMMSAMAWTIYEQVMRGVGFQ